MHALNLLSFVLAARFIVVSQAVTLMDWKQLTTSTYDYVIIGAGNAGLVVANRLSEDPSVSVLVIEAGVSDEGAITTQMPFLGPTLTPSTIYDWNYTIVPQGGMNGRTFPYPRGRILGGSSTVNYCFHQYGSNEDWERLARISGDSKWSWSNMRKYITRHEKFEPPVDGHNTTGQYIPSLHSTSGILPVSLPGNNQSIDSRVMAATGQLPEFPYNEDMAGGDHSLLGVGFLQSSAGGGVRSSSSTSYLAQANGRPNLTVVINTVVTKLLQTGITSNGLKSFRGVAIANSPGTSSTPAGSSSTVFARKEVILSAGSVGTVQILQLSGIGNSADLQKLGIHTIVDNADVGENLSDHTFLPNIFNVGGDQSFDNTLRSEDLLDAAVEQWVQNKTGLLANNIVNNFGFGRIPANTSIFSTVPDPAAGPNSPHWEMITANFWSNPGVSEPATGNFMSFVMVLLTPTSRGNIKIKSTNPFDHPVIDPKYLTTEFDIVAMREAVKAMKRFAGAPAFSDYIIGPYGSAFAAAVDDASIDSYVRGLTTTIFHPVGTASMSASSSTSGVVNPDLTVKRTDGLRIVDASIFPFIPSSHTQGPVYLVAERASDIIRGTD